MTGLACVASDAGHPTEQLLDKMLSALKHRGASRRTRLVLPEGYNISIGCTYNAAVTQQFHETTDETVALDGAFYLARKNQAKHLRDSVRNKLTLRSQPGGYSAICYVGKRLFALRDVNGLKPLYYAQRDGLVAVASERKALWTIGLNDTDRLNPGWIYNFLPRASRECFTKFNRPPERTITMDEAASHLTRLLRRSIRLVTKHVDHVAVAFSGGIDSAVTATLAKRAGKSIELISVGLTNSPEMREVEKYAKQLDLPITTETYSDDSMEEYVRRIVWLIEDHSLMKVSVAVPLHWAATRAQKSGHTLMLCGQGSDELYGGYYKYARILDEQGREALRAALYRSVLDAAAVNYERDDQATSPFGVTLRTPFADHDLIRFSLTIPSEYKVKQGNDLVRKWVLRAAAKKLQVPEEMIWRRKKAIQHGTGVEDAIRRLAKTGGISVASYLANIYTHMAREPSMP